MKNMNQWMISELEPMLLTKWTYMVGTHVYLVFKKKFLK
jgi:hypothetical protein